MKLPHNCSSATSAAARKNIRLGILLFLTYSLFGCTSWIELAGRNSAGDQGNGNFHSSSALSEDGRYVTFVSDSTNLVSGDTNGMDDVFVRDLLTGITERVSVSATGQQANADSVGGDISGNGEWIVFSSEATNLIPGGTDGTSHVYLKNRLSGAITLLSKQNLWGTQGNGDSGHARISKDGNWVAYESTADNIIFDDTNGYSDIFLYDRVLGFNSRVSVDTGGPHGIQLTGPSIDPDISDNGQQVVFLNQGGYGVVVLLRDRSTAITEKVNSGLGYQCEIYWPICKEPAISGNGRVVAYTAIDIDPSRTAGGYADQVFVYDRDLNQYTALLTNHYCSFESFWFDCEATAGAPSLSGDGRFVSYSTRRSQLPSDNNGARDVYLKDRYDATGPSLWRVSTDTYGLQVAGVSSSRGALSHDGRYILFRSGSSMGNLTEDATPGNSEAVVKATPPIGVDNVIPSVLARGASTTVIIYGHHFMSPDMSVTAPGVTFSNVQVLSGFVLLADVVVSPSATLGLTNLTVKLDGTGPGPDTGSTGFCLNCFEIVD